MPIEVIVAPQFFRDASKLQKRYPSILKDVGEFRERLAGGETPGDQVSGVSYAVYKARVKNRDARRGKSGGYRVIYYLETDEQTVLLTIYSKSDQSDIPIDVIRRIIAEYEAKKP